MLRARWLRGETAARQDGRVAAARASLVEFCDRGDFEDRGVGVVEGIEQTFQALRNRLLGLRLRSCRVKKILVITKYYNAQIICQRRARGARQTDLTWRI
jgi:hypothetical protein